MAQYVKKDSIIEAIQFESDDISAAQAFIGSALLFNMSDPVVYFLRNNNAVTVLSDGLWVIKQDDKISTMDDAKFEATYELR